MEGRFRAWQFPFGSRNRRPPCPRYISGRRLGRRSSFVEPTLFACSDSLSSKYVNEIEVFGPVATLIPYDSIDDLVQIARRGNGSLVGSIFSNDLAVIQNMILGIGDLHGRLMVVDSTVGSQLTGHGTVVPSCLHGGPGRADGGEELGGLRALQIYHRRFVVQASPQCLTRISDKARLRASCIHEERVSKLFQGSKIPQ